METSGALNLQSCTWVGFEKVGKRPGRLLRFSLRFADDKLTRRSDIECLRPNGASIVSRNRVVGNNGVGIMPKVYCSHNTPGALEPENSIVYTDEAVILKRKAESVGPLLSGRCIYLVGMMGSGKTTIGKILSEALSYSFIDSDRLVEKAVGGASVAQIFTEHNEEFFRDNESKVLRNLSSMQRLVVATGGGAVIWPVNWRYMKQGITVWLDVPLEALARRIASVGTASRPLLHHETGDAYTKALLRLRALFEERGEFYTQANARVSLDYIAAKQGKGDVNVLTPTAIVIEVLVRIENILRTGRLEEVNISMEEA